MKNLFIKLIDMGVSLTYVRVGLLRVSLRFSNPWVAHTSQPKEMPLRPLRIPHAYLKLSFLFLLIFTYSCTLKTHFTFQKSRFDNQTPFTKDSSQNIGQLSYKQFSNDSYLNSLIDNTLKNNFDLQIAIQRIETFRSQFLAAKGLLYPKLDQNTSFALRKFGLYTMDGAGNISTFIEPGKIVPTHLPDFFIGFQSQWEIDIWGKLKNYKKAAYAQLLASEEAQKWVQVQLIFAVAQLYYELLSLDYEIDIAEKTYEKQKSAIEILQYQKDAGRVNELAVSQFNAQILGTQILKNELEKRRNQIENQILFLSGSLPQIINRDKSLLNQDFPWNFKNGNFEQFLQQRPDIKEADKIFEASQFQWIASKKAFYPTLNLNSFIASQSFRHDLLHIFPASLAYTLLSSFTTPFLNRTALKAQFLSSKSQVYQAFYQYQKTLYQAYYEIATVDFYIQKQKEIIQLSQKQNDVLNEAVEISRDLFKTGKANYLEVLLAQQNALNAQINLIEERKKLKISEWNLYKSLGGGK